MIYYTKFLKRRRINMVLSKLRVSSMFSLERKRKKNWYKLPNKVRFVLLKRQLNVLLGPNVKKSDEEIRKAQEEFLNYEYKRE